MLVDAINTNQENYATWKSPKTRRMPSGGYFPFANAKTLQRVKTIDSFGQIQRQLDEVDALQRRWDAAVGIQGSQEKDDKKKGKKDALQYNPVLARWNWERARTDEEKEQFRRAEIFNVKTALRERNKAERSDLSLYFDTRGKIRNEAYHQEAWEDVLERGVVYCEKEFPDETTRVRAEKAGFLKIQEEFSKPDAKKGTIAVIISGPGLAKGSPFDHNFVDGYQLLIDEQTGERKRVPYTRFSSPLDYDAYKAIVQKIDPHYFERKRQQEKLTNEKIPDDAWYLANPLFFEGYNNIDEVFEEHFEKDVKAMEEREFEELWKIYLPYVLYYIGQLTLPNFDPIAMAKAWNTIHHSVENKKLRKETEGTPLYVAPEVTSLNSAEHQRIAGVVDSFGTQEVEEKKVGCGSSGGFSLNKKGSPFDNSAAAYGNYTGENAKNDPNLCHCGAPAEAHFHCPTESGGCGHPILVGMGIKNCPNEACPMEAVCT